MLSVLKKRTCLIFLAGIMFFVAIASPVHAAEEIDVVSKEKLTEIVIEDVNSLDFNVLGVDNIINNINNATKEAVTKMVKEIQVEMTEIIINYFNRHTNVVVDKNKYINVVK